MITETYSQKTRVDGVFKIALVYLRDDLVVLIVEIIRVISVVDFVVSGRAPIEVVIVAIVGSGVVLFSVMFYGTYSSVLANEVVEVVMDLVRYN